ncbi:helix-turn-helix transcriptional regulator [Campylobacter pinnipediorum]|uniref:helix-turn-helix transcriptional regulator n=1 Tax=Campylobacter pinnipediorum TaxID=1965231 RepID=UPI00099524A0|nr:helix-turn-helix domain-containing protein [Campylobacter pinnipediorum]OPA71877.1 hypothetical protein BB381_07005 [Campylobacter pinnipediorum subsp. caledonicus]
MQDTYITAKMAKEKLGVSDSGLYRLRQSGKIKANRVSYKTIYYSLNSINAYQSMSLNYQDNHSTTASA